MCGLKHAVLPHKQEEHKVTPFVGVWIETTGDEPTPPPSGVTPFVGVWIETLVGGLFGKSNTSHPSWVCGLKQQDRV